MSYIDGFVLAVPTANKEKYIEHSKKAFPFFKKLGAIRMVECWGDDVPKGNTTDFYRAVNAQDDETVLFSWVVYPDKETRDAANEKMMNDPEIEKQMGEMPFDGARMIFGGFEPILDIEA